MAANEEVQLLEKAVLDTVPALMKTLETLSKVHPFAAGAPMQTLDAHSRLTIILFQPHSYRSSLPINKN